MHFCGLCVTAANAAGVLLFRTQARHRSDGGRATATVAPAPSPLSGMQPGKGNAVAASSQRALIESMTPSQRAIMMGEDGKKKEEPPKVSKWAISRAMKKVVEQKRFDQFIILSILVNCIFLCLWDPLDLDETSPRNLLLNRADLVFQIIFTIEMVMKHIAWGAFFGKGAYWKDSWNIIDGVLVLLGWVTYIPATGDLNLTSVRVVRVLRPLRTINSMPGLKKLINSLLLALPQLANVFILCMFIFFIFGILGVQLFQGKLHQRCYWPAGYDGNDEPTLYEDWPHLCNLDWDPQDPTVGRPCPEVELYDGSKYQTFCTSHTESMNLGITNFDNIGVTFLTIFQMITLEGWVDVMYWIEDTMTAWSNWYFLLLVIAGSLFLLNLVVAVIIMNLSMARDEDEDDAADTWANMQGGAPIAGRKPTIADMITALVAAHREREAMARQAVIEEQERQRTMTSMSRKLKKLESMMSKRDGSKRKMTMSASASMMAPAMPDEPPLPVAVGDNWMDATMNAAMSKGTKLGPAQKRLAALLKASAREEVRQRRIERKKLTKGMSPRVAAMFMAPLHGKDSMVNSVVWGAAGGLARALARARARIAERNPPKDDSAEEASQERNAEDKQISVRDVASAVTREQSFRNPPGRLPPLSATPSLATTVSGSPLPSLGEGRELDAHEMSLPTPDELAATLSSETTADANGEPRDPKVVADELQRTLSRATNILVVTGGSQDAINALAEAQQELLRLKAELSRDEESRQTVPQMAKRYLRFDETTTEEESSESEWISSSDSDLDDMALYEPDEYAKSYRKIAYAVATHRYFVNLIMGFILVNTLFLAAEFHGMPQWLKELTEDANLVFTFVFLGEMVIKIAGFTVEGYASDSFNLFDGCIVMISVLELLMADSEGGGLGVSALRTFRLLRVFKLARSWESLNQLLGTMARSLPRIGPFSVVLLLFMFIFSLVGMQLFGGQLNDPETGEPPRSHYDDLLWALVTTFQILTGENWNETMYEATDKVGLIAPFYFVTVVIIGSFIVLNLFLGILIDHFMEEGDAQAEAAQAKVERAQKKLERERKLAEKEGRQIHVPLGAAPGTSGGAEGRLKQLGGARPLTMADTVLGLMDKEDGEGNKLAPSGTSHAVAMARKRAEILEAASRTTAKEKRRQVIAAAEKQGGPSGSALLTMASQAEATAVLDDKDVVERLKEAQAKKPKFYSCNVRRFPKHPSYNYRSLFCLNPGNGFRVFLGNLALHPLFGGFILLLILLSCILLAMESEETPPETIEILDEINIVVSFLFLGEMVIKMLAMGIFNHPGAYLTDGWNRLDCFIVVVSMVDFFLGGTFSFIKALRFMRAIRPLRVVRRLRGLRVVLNAVVRALPHCVHVALVSLLFFCECHCTPPLHSRASPSDI